jgi:hypothetical protein
MNEFDGLNDTDPEIRINELREAAQEAAGGDMTTQENPDMPPELAESFWGNVLAFESAEETWFHSVGGNERPTSRTGFAR